MPTEPTPKLGKTVPIGQLVYAIGEVETGHIKSMAQRYKVVNSIGATGRYQVMKANIPEWTRQALGKSLTLDEWLNSPKSQDKVAAYKLGALQKKYGSWESAASVWFSGQPDPNSKASDGHFTVRQYVDDAREFLTGGKSVDAGGGTSSGSAEPAGFVDGLLDGLNMVTKPFVDIANAMLSVGQFAEFLLKLALPSTWVRIVCGLFGIAFLMGGLVVLGLEAKGA
jgi:hypothetical protein